MVRCVKIFICRVCRCQWSVGCDYEAKLPLLQLLPHTVAPEAVSHLSKRIRPCCCRVNGTPITSLD